MFFQRKPENLQQDISTCDELKALTQTQGSFLLWPRKFDESGQKLDLDKNVCALSLKLNKKMLSFFVGFSTAWKQLGHKDFLVNLLTVLNDFWNVSWQKEAANAEKNSHYLNFWM